MAGANSTGSSPTTSYITPATVSAVRAGVGSITTDAATMAAAATYLWSKVSGDDFTINTLSVQATTFSADLSDGEVRFGTYKCVTTTPTATGYVNVSGRSTSTL